MFNALFVADVREHLAKHRHAAFIPGGDHQSAHRHERKQTDGFDGNGLTAGVRAGNDQCIELLAELNVHGDDRLQVNQRMARRAQEHIAGVVYLGYGSLECIGEVGLGKDEVEFHRALVTVNNGLRERACFRGKFGKNAFNLFALFAAQDADFVVGLNHGHRLHKHRRAA
ncbi:hypothetical protein SDC9_177537 [bioreactor metagenome]|uniref:Uncharacterized protein n=1 Tax=bioreactor metagenome TaxID=1076179 RepID=A0A645GUR5_9ZZZZ